MSIFLDFKRIIKAGLVNFRRNGVVSIASILVMVATLFVIGSLVIGNALLDFIVSKIENKVDINIYFYPTATESTILSLKDALEGIEEVESVEYVSREAALESFKERHQDDLLILQSLEELNTNPLGATLNVKATETNKYSQVVEFIESDEAIIATGGKEIIEYVNYNRNALVIERITSIMEGIQNVGLVISLLLFLISIIVTFNTLRLGLFISKEEISIMRLVGAENRYIRGPFLVEGILYGTVATLITMFVFYVVLNQVNDFVALFIGGFNVFHYFLENFWQMFSLLLSVGVLLGVVSFVMIIRRYLKT